jgi:uncharacterized Zn finger protein
MTTTQFSRSWWGERFLAALESFTSPGRLARGRAYARNGRVISHTVERGGVTALIRGSVNPYFGVFEEPVYTTTISMKPISGTDWNRIVGDLAQKASFVTQLLMGEMPDSIDTAFQEMGVPFLPRDASDFSTFCTCPDWENPCKHVAGLCYLLAIEFDHDPFLLFQLRGLTRSHLRYLLTSSPLGQILASEMEQHEMAIDPDLSYFAQPARQGTPSVSHREFWEGTRRLPELQPADLPSVAALIVKKQGDYPSFWERETSFLATMEELYDRVRAKSPEMK